MATELEAHLAVDQNIERLVSSGRLSAAQADALANDGRDSDLDTIDEQVAVALQEAALAGQALQLTLRLGLSLRRRNSMLKRREVLARLQIAQTALGLRDEAAATFLQSLQIGDPVIDYRPRADNVSFASANRAKAARVHEQDAERYRQRLTMPPSPVRDPGPRRTAESVATTHGAEAVGLDRLTVWGSVRAQSIGARYRFEYGTRPDSLDRATAWTGVPPPRTGQVRERADRIFGDWIPRSTHVYWQSIAEQPSDGGRFALCLQSPFAKDRNQLSGIGSHEMPLNIGWCHSTDAGYDPKAIASYSVGGGELDLRDAEISFVVAAERLMQKGAALHFWIGRKCQDALGPFTSQWALTGAPFPDEAFEGPWRRVTITLPSDPTAWTYTGNNPKEQGVRANRYRRAPLDETIASVNDPFVLIFAFGAERDPPTGMLKIAEMSARYRDYSVLGPAAGAVLISQPDAACPANVMTDGRRGFDDALWISDNQPRFPLTFEWKLRGAVTLTRLQLNQHPYWPAKQVRISVANEAQEWSLLWQGEMTDVTGGASEVPYSYIALPRPVSAARLKLEILSAYRAERCGLDSIEAFGEGALYQPDAEPCSVNTELTDFGAGATVFARLVLDDDGRVIHGNTVRCTIPLTQAPVLASAHALARPGNPACIVLRASAMGLETQVAGKLVMQDGATFDLGNATLGMQPTFRHLYYNVPDETPLLPGKVHLTLSNGAGTTYAETAWPPPAPPSFA